jgi:hypothetical protein
MLVFLAALLALRVGPPSMPALGDDFIEYWSAARLNTQGLNPYDPILMLTLERELGWEMAQPRMMWNPPHTMALFSPFLLLEYDVAKWVWRGLALLATLLCAILIWRTSGGPAGDAAAGRFP